MRKPWSISTTVRNPDRVRGFLRVLSELESRIFDEGTQIEYQTLLIKNKLYKPVDLPKKYEKYYSDPKLEMPKKVAEKIFNFMRSKSEELDKDPGLRGRTSVAPLSKMGFCIAKESLGEIKITDYGRLFLEDEYDIQKIFFTHFLKWQLPNPYSEDFPAREGFNIKPFIATLHIIKKANNKWESLGNKPVGLSKDEFNLFVPTTINYRDINTTVNNIIKYRQNCRVEDGDEYRKQYWENYVIDFYGLDSSDRKRIQISMNNLRDYGDNAIRYFRLTNYIYLRGGGYYVDLEPRRLIEIDKLLEIDDARVSEFEDLDSYIDYITDISRPELPWENVTELKNIFNTIKNEVQGIISKINSEYPSVTVPVFTEINIDGLTKLQAVEYVEKYRKYRRTVSQLYLYHKAQSIENLTDYIKTLKEIRLKETPALFLEYLTTMAMNSLNDALKIKPNYPVGDDGMPTFTAPSNKPDIECYYNSFNILCEVTMLTGRNQWYNEGQPVMRHVRDFEDKIPNTTYCLFIAPALHRDTINTFWTSVKYDYEGRPIKIIPLKISHVIKILEAVRTRKSKNKFFSSAEIKKLLDMAMSKARDSENSKTWILSLDSVVNSWCGEVINA